MRILTAVIIGIFVVIISIMLITFSLTSIFEILTPHLFPLPNGMSINNPKAQDIAITRVLVPIFTTLAATMLGASFLGATIARKISKGATFATWMVISWPAIATIITFTHSISRSHDLPIYGYIGIGACGFLLPPLGAFLAQKYTRPFFFVPKTA